MHGSECWGLSIFFVLLSNFIPFLQAKLGETTYNLQVPEQQLSLI